MSEVQKNQLKSQYYYSEPKRYEKQKIAMYAALGLVQYEANKAFVKWDSIIINQKSIYDEQIQDK